MIRRLIPFALAAGCLPGLLPAQTVTWWNKGFDEALTAAADAPAKLVLLYCWQDKHDTCSAMFAGTMSDERAQKQLAEFVCMGIKNDDDGKEVWQRYRVQSVPTVYLIAPSGDVVDLVVGYATIEDFVATLQRVRAGTDTIPALQKALDGSKDLVKMQLLMQKQLQMAQPELAMKTIDAMIAIDPKGKSEQAAEAQLWKITQETFKDGVAPADIDLGPLRRFLKSQRNKRVRFLGYDRMATAHWAREELKEAAAAAEQAWKNIPDDRIVDWGQRMCGFAYAHWQDLDKTNKSILKTALKVSKKTLAVIEKQHKKQPDNTFLGNAMFLHAAVLIVNKKRKDGLELMEKAIEIDPKNENLKTWHKRWLAGDK